MDLLVVCLSDDLHCAYGVSADVFKLATLNSVSGKSVICKISCIICVIVLL